MLLTYQILELSCVVICILLLIMSPLYKQVFRWLGMLLFSGNGLVDCDRIPVCLFEDSEVGHGRGRKQL